MVSLLLVAQICTFNVASRLGNGLGYLWAQYSSDRDHSTFTFAAISLLLSRWKWRFQFDWLLKSVSSMFATDKLLKYNWKITLIICYQSTADADHFTFLILFHFHFPSKKSLPFIGCSNLHIQCQYQFWLL